MMDYIIYIVSILLVLYGINSMSKVETSKKGNLLSALAMLIAVCYIIYKFKVLNAKTIMALIIASIFSLYGAKKVKMIQMPESVAMLNAFGGLASCFVAIVSLYQILPDLINHEVAMGAFNVVTAFLAIFIGMVTFVGSTIAALKLAKKIDGRPIVLNNHDVLINGSLILSLLSAILFFITKINIHVVILMLIVFSIAFGILFAIRVGGADMPIVISLLNSTSGVAASISGMAIFNYLLISVGAIVGASGLILTQIMCVSMNRSLRDILIGKTKKTINTLKTKQKITLKNDDITHDKEETKRIEEEKTFSNLKKVLIVPGYGMALSQAQSKVKEITDELEKQGCEVEFAIHPVAGRMPGHMNVLLAEVDIDYDKFIEMDEANKLFKDSDLVICIGANDVINPAANTAEGTPIYQMPVLNVSDSKNIIICNYDTKPGYAGVENPLYKDEKVKLYLGDAKESLDKILDELRNKKNFESAKEEKVEENQIFSNLKKVLIVPGYGMALSQAQSKVKEITDELEKQGCEVEFAIHPVAGRMPGHMNVLLAEVDIDYDKFIEMDEANKLFKDSDLVICIGANDVINPAANTAEGTPIYQMPVLNVSDSKNIIICNYDTKPGYAGVENPLYKDEKVKLYLGDAKESLDKILKKLKEMR